MQNHKEIKSVSIVGTGNVGHHLAKAMHEAGFRVLHVLSRFEAKASELAEMVSAEAVVSISDIEVGPDLLVFCVKDEVLPELISDLTDKDTIVVHTSGNVGMEIFKGKCEHYGVFYPLQTFSIEQEMDYQEIPFLIEGSDPAVEATLMDAARRISDKGIQVNSVLRRKIHLAAVFACNFSNHMVAIAKRLLNEENLELQLLLPLLEQTYKKLMTMDPISAQTGPAIRADQKVITSQEKELENKPDELEIYRLLTKNIMKYKT